MKTHIDTSKDKSNWGGKRLGAGRKEGSQNKATLEQKVVEQELRQRIMNSAQSILDAQFALAKGCSYLYYIAKDKDGKKQKPVLVEDRETIEAYLADELDEPDTYYYITAEKPSSIAIDSLFDRVFGKPKQSIEHSGDADNPIALVIDKASSDTD